MSDEMLALANVELIDPQELGPVAVIAKVDESSSGKGLVGKADAFLGMAADVLEIADGANLYKVTVPDGYTLKDLVPSKKDAESVRALVKDSNGKLNGDVALKANGVSPAQIASVGLAAAAMVVGQAYMTEISDSLQKINSKLDLVEAMLVGEQKARVKNAIGIAGEYMNSYEDYLRKPKEAFQAARSEIEHRYNDVGEVADWVTERLYDIEKRAMAAKATEKDVAPLLDELHALEDQFSLCLQALSALAMTRMYYDGCIDERDASLEQERIARKSRAFLDGRQMLSGMLELKIGSLKGAPLALPQGNSDGNVLKRLISQTPRAAAKEQLLETKAAMQSGLRNATVSIKDDSLRCANGIARIVSTSQRARTMLTDGESCWIIEDVAGDRNEDEI